MYGLGLQDPSLSLSLSLSPFVTGGVYHSTRAFESQLKGLSGVERNISGKRGVQSAKCKAARMHGMFDGSETQQG